jgi:hypothetical protein
MQSLCPVGEIVVTLNAEGVEKVGDNREGVDGSVSNKVGDAERDEVTHDGVTVFRLEGYIDGLKEGIVKGAEVKYDGETVGNLDEYINGTNVGIKDGRLVSLTV